MYRLAISLLASAVIVFQGGTALGAATAPQQPKIIATVVAHAHHSSSWVASAPHGL